jgi:hypothetical protein
MEAGVYPGQLLGYPVSPDVVKLRLTLHSATYADPTVIVVYYDSLDTCDSYVGRGAWSESSAFHFVWFSNIFINHSFIHPTNHPNINLSPQLYLGYLTDDNSPFTSRRSSCAGQRCRRPCLRA